MVKFLSIEDSLLKPFIHNAYYIEMEAGEVSNYNCMPSVFPMLSILFNAELIDSNQGIRIQPCHHSVSSYIVLPYTKPIRVKTKGPFHELSIAFKPLALDCFLSRAFQAASKSEVMLAATLWGKEFELLEKVLENLNDEPQKRLDQLLDFLQVKGNEYGKLSENFYPNERMKTLYQQPERTFYRQFKELSYLTPKQFNRIIRLRNSLNQAKEDNKEKLTGVAYDQGYFDQAHFSRECKSISTKSPKELLKSLVCVKSDALWFEEF
ncbi:MAG: helix-turn-helix domain-containing protein [Marinifilaceae bacterium]